MPHHAQPTTSRRSGPARSQSQDGQAAVTAGGPLQRGLNGAPGAQAIAQLQRQLNDGPHSRSLARMNETLNVAPAVAQSVAQLTNGHGYGTRSQPPQTFLSLEPRPQSSGGSFLNILPQQTEQTPMMQLTNEMEMLVNQVGRYAPQTVAYSSGLQQVTPYARERESNEQGVGFRALAEQDFPPPTPFPNTARTANTMMASYPNAPMIPNMQGNIQSLHGVARSLGPVESGRDPRNYIGGTQVSNLAMTGVEHALGSLPSQQRSQYSMQTTFYSDPNVPLAHGINMQVFHPSYPTPVLTANYTGFDTSTTRQQVEQQLSSNRAYFQSVPSSGGQHYSEQNPQAQYPNYSPQEMTAATTMLNMPHTVTFGTNPWQQNARNL